jgi:lipoate-protein ligase A
MIIDGYEFPDGLRYHPQEHLWLRPAEPDGPATGTVTVGVDAVGAEALGEVVYRIGGGTVFLDPRRLLYQCVFHRRRAPFAVEALYRRFLTPPVRALQALGLPAALEGVNEIEVGGRRIAGTGSGQIGEAVVVVGNLLFDFPASVLSRAWRVPSAAFRRLAEDGLRRHLATLSGVLRPYPSEAEVRRRLIREYETALGRPLVRGELTGLEETVVRREERRLARLPGSGGRGGLGDASLKLTRRVWVQEWTWLVGEDEVRVTARITDGRIEELVVAGQALDRAEAARRVLEALGPGPGQ